MSGLVSDHDGMVTCIWCTRRFTHDDGDGYCPRCAGLKARGHTYAEIQDKIAAMQEDMERNREEE